VLGASSGEIFVQLMARILAIAAVGVVAALVVDRRRRVRGQAALDRRCFVPRVVFMACWTSGAALGVALLGPRGSAAALAPFVVLVFVVLLAAERPLRRHEQACRNQP
jgi:hypothetical protein